VGALLAVLPYAELHGQQLTVRNIRNCEYLSESDYIVRHYDKTFDLNRLESVDFLVVPFKGHPVWRTRCSASGSVETIIWRSRSRHAGGRPDYSPIKGLMRQYELMYVVADERDVIPLRTKHRDVDVYLYRTRTTPEQARILLLDMMARANKLAVEPEFYDTFTNNCTTNIVNHINRVAPGKIGPSVGVLVPGLSDRLAYDLGLLDTTDTFERTKNGRWSIGGPTDIWPPADFSQRIRRY
jgi:hypothetical protein